MNGDGARPAHACQTASACLSLLESPDHFLSFNFPSTGTDVSELYALAIQRLASSFPAAAPTPSMGPEDGEGGGETGAAGAAVRRLLALVRASRHGLSEPELVQLLGLPRLAFSPLFQVRARRTWSPRTPLHMPMVFVHLVHIVHYALH